MKMISGILVAMSAGLGLLLAADIKTDFDHSADFNRYHTYSWLKVDAGNSLWQDRIKQDINEQLQAKGWSPVENGGDTSITAFGSTKNQQQLNTFYDGFGGWYWRSLGTATTTVENVPVGTLVVHIFDSSTKKLIWTGTSTETLSDKPDKNDKKLEKSVQDMFKKFPPNAKS